MSGGKCLRIWSGDWDLPSVDYNCLAAMAYCKFTETPVTFQGTNNPFWSKTGGLPVLKHEGGSEYNLTDIINFLRKQGRNAEFGLSKKQNADILAYTSLIEEKLLPALLYCQWVDTKNLDDFTRPWYFKAMPFPFRYYLPASLEKSMDDKVRSMCGCGTLTNADIEKKVYREARECLNQLSNKLGTFDFFYGKNPTYLDAVIFGYLAVLYKTPLPNNPLKHHIQSCDNLVRFINRILHRFFQLTPEETTEQERKESERQQEKQDISDFPHKKRNMIISALVALSAMVGYALLSGLVQIEITETNGEGINNDYEDDFEPDEDED
ncbi:unnamed protein product [Owenia fusiformis]|uniref:Uncharacterized protein n=1 Tax=Owenia fusiformis TaxID=6347 RepID=A0A8J1TYP7_OWEFU|nr:unnamed protein product [Owenia fusiformis]